MKRRDFFKRAGIAGIGLALLPGGFRKVNGASLPASTLLSDAVLQPKFTNMVPDALAPSFIYQQINGRYMVDFGQAIQYTGLVNTSSGVAGEPVATTIWGYGDHNDKLYTWPGRTFQIKNLASGGGPTLVTWGNDLVNVTQHLLPIDTNTHWCYSLPGYTQYTIANAGVPAIVHLHGGHIDYQFDGYPESFFTPNQSLMGPSWNNVPGGFTNDFNYINDVPAKNLWYHDHALGITRLNVYAGLAGFYFIRDNNDTGLPDNPLGLPAWPYEKAYAIQDRMFTASGELFYPAYRGDPAYDDFITENPDANLPPELFPLLGGPTALAEFFGDHMLVNGIIWPKEDVEPRLYRFHLLNGCDSRFLAIRFRVAATLTSTGLTGAGQPLPFSVIGSDQGLAASPTTTDLLLVEPGSRYDIIFDFKGLRGKRIIMENFGGDSPFGGDIPWERDYTETDKIMAFDVADIPDSIEISPDTTGSYSPSTAIPTRTRKVALFEGRDEYGRIFPMLGTAEPATDYMGNPINWPMMPEFMDAGLIGQIRGSLTWSDPATENPALNSTEIWEIWNATMDAHPIHLHLVHFDIIGRKQLIWDSMTNEDHLLLDFEGNSVSPNGDGAYLTPQPVVAHNGNVGIGARLVATELAYGSSVVLDPTVYVENAPKDMVVALPNQITYILVTFDKPGRYVWHCHILSHEDHDMMRVLHVGPMSTMTDVAQNTTPTAFSLAQNYPNPFNPSTTISFYLPNRELVELKVFNILGQEVRTLANSIFAAGTHNVVWDGKSSGGRSVASGVYIYQIKAGKFSMSKKMNLMR